jgi:hypothetical protein
MRFSAYVLFLLAISIPMYMFGETNMVGYFTSNKTISLNNTNTTYSLGNSTLPMTCPSGDIYCQGTQDQPSLLWGFIAVLLAAAILTIFLQGFAAVYIIPALFLVTFINVVVLPYSFIFDPAMPDLIKMPLVALLNIITVLAVVDFIRGGA